ncbi:FAD-dependent oxidoreductase [Carboxydothermus pertinax]|uniref:4Fe-4S ferredoxin-type domain-containing protein n=1 Tax=Carboxydothermus pertinax TaxID=870242 RepID=A0A1L8CUB0_9THEO|nr:FAD-dependent oxidoreductase [Carboxydothermus pertinax]GAV22491.1 hypothetical protein cpu_10010 [Carboxydothermus pertinax]
MAKKFLVVGAGAVGLQIALDLEENGHEVWLVEETSMPGGKFNSQKPLEPGISLAFLSGIYHPGDYLYTNKAVSLMASKRAKLFYNTKVSTINKINGKFSVEIVSQNETLTEVFDSIYLTPGFVPFNPEERAEYLYGINSFVLTGLELENLLKTGELKKNPPEKIAFIQCVGSRNNGIGAGKPYCSGFCCLYSLKEIDLLKQALPDTEIKVFYLDLRLYNKGAEKLYRKALAKNVIFIRNMISAIKEEPKSYKPIVRYLDNGRFKDELFDLVVLAQGADLGQQLKKLLANFNISEKEIINFSGTPENPHQILPGIYFAGSLLNPMDGAESMISAGSSVFNEVNLNRDIQPEIAVKNYPNTGIIYCNCRGSIPVDELKGVAENLPEMVVSDCLKEEELNKIKKFILDNQIGRTVFVGCSKVKIKTGLEKLALEENLGTRFEVVNIKEQGFSLYGKEKLKSIARTMVAGTLARIQYLKSPILNTKAEVNLGVTIIGGGLAGLKVAEALTAKGVPVTVIEKQNSFGGRYQNISIPQEGLNLKKHIETTVTLLENRGANLFKNTRVVEVFGGPGKYKLLAERFGQQFTLETAAIVLATGAQKSYGNFTRSQKVIYQEDFYTFDNKLSEYNSIGFLQCAGSRNVENPLCSRNCCIKSLDTALYLKEKFPQKEVYIFYQDIMAYGKYEFKYLKARDMGVKFIPYDRGQYPEFSTVGDKIKVITTENYLDDIYLDLLVLAEGTKPKEENRKLAEIFKVGIDEFGFLRETHQDISGGYFPKWGVFIAGEAQGPKTVMEILYSAQNAAKNVLAFLNQIQQSQLKTNFSEVIEEKCAACLTCVRVCPYSIPEVINGKNVAYIDPIACQGCGVCASECPNKAIVQHNRPHDGVLAEIRVLAGEGK